MGKPMDECVFCAIAAGQLPAAIIHQDDEFLAIPDIGQIRRGHTLVFPREHVETFEQMAPEPAARLMQLGQRIARAQKQRYGVERVGFLLTGGDVPHVHAHLVPMVEKTDLTSRRYIQEQTLTFRALPPTTPDTLTEIASELREILDISPSSTGDLP